jgi:hypothetical protein
MEEHPAKEVKEENSRQREQQPKCRGRKGAGVARMEEGVSGT